LFLLEAAKKFGLEFSTIENAIKINQEIPKYITNSIKKSLDGLNLEKTILVCGLAYKKDVEDMRDSPGFKLVKEMTENGFDVSVFDPYYKSELLEKYLIENHIQDLKINQKNNLDFSSLKGINCICIVQHHTKNNHRLREIYEKSLVPLIYDCQREIRPKLNSKTSLEFFGA